MGLGRPVSRFLSDFEHSSMSAAKRLVALTSIHLFEAALLVSCMTGSVDDEDHEGSISFPSDKQPHRA